MEWTIPIQNFNPKHVHIGPFHRNSKNLLSLAYEDAQFSFLSLCLLLPTLNVKSYDPSTGRLALSLAGNTATQFKLQQFQELLFHAIQQNAATWFPPAQGQSDKDLHEIRAGFQPFLEGSMLHLYCPATHTATGNSSSDIHFYSKGAWTRGVPAGLTDPFPVGTPIRLAVRIFGISFHLHPVTGVWTGRFRLQHRIVAIYTD
jgi:hypothetical protein